MNTREVDPFMIYCDGACEGGNLSRVSGWGYVILKDGNVIKYNSGLLDKEEEQTNQRAELRAAVEGMTAALELSKNNIHPTFEVYSDSAYFINCVIDQWWKRWLKNGWMNAKRQPVANQDYWVKLVPYFDLKTWTFHKVEGHSTNTYNNMADKLATDACKVKIQGEKNGTRLLI